MKNFLLLFLVLLIVSCKGKKEQVHSLFEKLPSDQTGLNFRNQLTENDSINILDNEFVYNGAGVALGDLNNDGLDDIFFGANQVENKLFLNNGNLHFTDITEVSKIKKKDSLQWSSGVTIIDINADGKQDIYVCNTFRKEEHLRKNLLFINQGNDEKGIPRFKEMAEKFNLDDPTYSSHAQFFDFDLDGDLDIWIGVNCIEGVDPNEYKPLEDDGTSISRDRLYENTIDEKTGNQIFIDISEEAGIRYHGYSHSSLIYDFNNDGLMDIYVANDFLSNDLVYINNGDGTFTNKADEIFKHFSFSAMGSDIADINNDGNMDLFTTEMQPYYNKRKKLFQGPTNYQREILTKKFNYHHQYTRNTLQLNRGLNPKTGLHIFSDIGMFAGVHETDWSWAPLFADFDSDGWQDLFITNGFPKDVTDRDFGDFKATMKRFVDKQQLINAIPEIKITNFVFRNKGEYQFEDKTKEWGIDFPTFSHGAAYGDLDKDGDLDIVVNNMNDEAILLQNNGSSNDFLRLKLHYKDENIAAIGAVTKIYFKNGAQEKSILSGRGYLSQPELVAHFGLGENKSIDSVEVQWPNQEIQKVENWKLNTEFEVYYDSNKTISPTKIQPQTKASIFEQVHKNIGLEYFSPETDYIDFNFQRTIPHKFSEYGPSISVGDVNNDDLDDVFMSASSGFEQKWFIQKSDGTFLQKSVDYKVDKSNREEDTATLLFDADGDNDLDLYITRGGAQHQPENSWYQDMLYINDGSGNFNRSAEALPNMRNNTSVIKAADYDKDGDLDLFVASRVLPYSYPSSDRSYLLRNDSKNGKVKFTDVTSDIAPDLKFPGLITDAIWTDFNKDSSPDLILVGEFMPIKWVKNIDGVFSEINPGNKLNELSGWWNSIASIDIDNDSDMDYVVGNIGSNLNFTGNEKEPVRLYAKDLDANGTIDPLLSYYLRDSMGTKREYLYHSWQDVTAQYVGIRKKFNSFGAFGSSTLPEMFADGLLDDAQVLELNYMKSIWIENLGNEEFKVHQLPLEAQIAPIYGVLPFDINGDQYTDLLLIGNDYGMETSQGRADAFMGLALENRGGGSFLPLDTQESKFFVPGNGKALARVNQANRGLIALASQNNDSLKAFKKTKSNLKKLLNLENTEIKAEIEYFDGNKKLFEFYWGNGFKSQSSRAIPITRNVKKVRIFDFRNKVRVIDFTPNKPSD